MVVQHTSQDLWLVQNWKVLEQRPIQKNGLQPLVKPQIAAGPLKIERKRIHFQKLELFFYLIRYFT